MYFFMKCLTIYKMIEIMRGDVIPALLNNKTVLRIAKKTKKSKILFIISEFQDHSRELLFYINMHVHMGYLLP